MYNNTSNVQIARHGILKKGLKGLQAKYKSNSNILYIYITILYTEIVALSFTYF